MDRYKVLGMMSGTSLDGLDLAYCHFWRNNDKWDFEIRQCTTVPYGKLLYEKLKHAIHLSEEEHLRLHHSYGVWLGEQAKSFIQRHQLQLDFIASHGHTSHHRPEEGITFQLGDGQQLANTSGHRAICNFRALDVRLGGQGAPLVPIGDTLLLSEYGFCLNLGGISNISFKKRDKRIAYDIGMANMPLNYVTEKIGIKYDEGGTLASSGKLLPNLLTQLNSLGYYNVSPPKSTGYEWFSTEVKPLIDATESRIEDVLHTLIHHNCEQIVRAIKMVGTQTGNRLLVTGGGALNNFFIHTLKEKLGKACTVVVPPKKFIEYKEAMVFALMGVLRSLGETNVLCTVTGARKNSSSGKIFFPGH